jgi:catechol 2,3-dioxygenase
MVRMAFRTVDPEDLDYYEKRLQGFGVKYEMIPEDYRRGGALRFQAPSGHTVERCHDLEYTGNRLPTVNPAPWPEGLKGIGVPRLDHTLVTAPEPQRAIQCFQEVLEFRTSDVLGSPGGTPLAAWLWQRPAPHDLAIVPGRAGGFHHAAFVVDSTDALCRAADILAMHNVRIDYGPGRHGITRGTTIDCFDPSGNRLETFGGYSAYQMDPDARPITWTQDQMAQAVFYYTQELNETFLSVYT